RVGESIAFHTAIQKRDVRNFLAQCRRGRWCAAQRTAPQKLATGPIQNVELRAAYHGHELCADCGSRGGLVEGARLRGPQSFSRFGVECMEQATAGERKEHVAVQLPMTHPMPRDIDLR